MIETDTGDQRSPQRHLIELQIEHADLDALIDQSTEIGAPSVQIHRTDHGFQGIGQDGGSLAAAGFQFTLTQTQHVGQLQLQRQRLQGVLFDEVGTHARQVAFGQLAQLRIQQVGHRQVEHRVPQEFQPLVVIGTEAAVRGGLQQQRPLAKSVAQAGLQV